MTCEREDVILRVDIVCFDTQKCDGVKLTEVMIDGIRIVDFHAALEEKLQKKDTEVILLFFFHIIIQLKLTSNLCNGSVSHGSHWIILMLRHEKFLLFILWIQLHFYHCNKKWTNQKEK